MGAAAALSARTQPLALPAVGASVIVGWAPLRGHAGQHICEGVGLQRPEVLWCGRKAGVGCVLESETLQIKDVVSQSWHCCT